MEPIITKVLLVENVRADTEAAVHHLRRDGLHVQVSMVDDERGFRRALETFAPDLILFDDALPYFSAREALKIARTTRPDLPFILFSASISETIAAEFLEQGVNDCVPKGNPTRLAHAVRRALRETGNQQATQVAGAQLCTGDSWYRDVVELSQDAIYVWRDGRMVFANRAMARLLGAHDPADLIGRSVFEFVHPECQHLAQMRMQKLLDGGTPLPPAELKYVRLDGSTVEVEAVGAPFEFQGRPAGHSILRDITERKALEKQRIESLHAHSKLLRAEAEAQQFRLLAEAAPGKVWTARPDGYVDYVNQRALERTGLEFREIEGWAWTTLLHPDDRARCLRDWKHCVASGENYEIEIRLLQGISPPEYRWHLVRGIPVRGEDQAILRWVGSSTDIHEAKEAQSLLQQSHDRLEEAVRQRTQKLMEVNAVLEAQVSETKQAEQALQQSQEALRQLSMHLQSARETERASVAREIHDELGSMLTAIKMNLHWFAKRLSAGEAPPAETLTTTIGVIDSAINTVQRISTELRPSLLDHLGLWPALEWQLEQFELHSGISCGLKLSTDECAVEIEARTAIFRIVQEALTNVARHARATRVEIEARQETGRLVVEIIDDGIGMPLEKTVRSDSFGLQGMQERARAFDGEVTLRTAPGTGTCVKISIPLTSDVATRPEPHGKATQS
jgi:PAS domain S-box-containing protein